MISRRHTTLLCGHNLVPFIVLHAAFDSFDGAGDAAAEDEAISASLKVMRPFKEMSSKLLHEFDIHGVFDAVIR